MKKNISIEMLEQLKHTTYEVSKDVLEIGLDGFIDNALVRDIPIIKWIHHVYDVVGYFNKQRLSKNILTFLHAYKENSLTDEEKKDFYNDIDKNIKVVEIIFLRLEEIVEEDKPKVLALLLKIIIKRNLDVSKFLYLSDLIKQISDNEYLMMSSLYTIYHQNNLNLLEQGNENKKVLKKLNNLGVLEEFITIPIMLGYSIPKYSYRLNEDGEIIAEVFYSMNPTKIGPV